MPAIHGILNNAYILFSFALGVWSAVQAGRNEPLTGGFWGALALNTALAGAVVGWSVIMALAGIPPARGVYFLYAAYFVVVLPGTFALLRGRDDRTAALLYAIIAIFSAAAATRVPLLTQYPS
ncbi:MAG: hypothetical protein JW910_10380 [Anaerolineae bacterium]|nr:hypothetical protein [Anaerolineae bacterium]